MTQRTADSLAASKKRVACKADRVCRICGSLRSLYLPIDTTKHTCLANTSPAGREQTNIRQRYTNQHNIQDGGVQTTNMVEPAQFQNGAEEP